MPPLRFALLLGLLLSAGAGVAAAQISPGPLARPHQALTGARNCLACHGTGKEAMEGACLSCHKEIGFLRAERRGLHGRGSQPRCASCHPDHAGAEFSLTGWTPDSVRRFDHGRAGWTLAGDHRTTECEDCHTAAMQKGRAATLAPKGAGPPRWTGLETACATCHEDVHRETLGGQCADCHDSDDWAPARRFDHSRTDYPLTGRHANVPCTECHAAKPIPPPPRESPLNPVFAPVASGQCSACHQDPHAGRLGPACADCHKTEGFAERKPGGFNHARTRYPLEGRHAAVACAACHGTAGRRLNPTYATCADCHADRHRGTATLAGAAVDCATCHDTRGFRVAILTVTRHAETRYPLEGKHAAVACASCHRPQPDGTLERPEFEQCASCHADSHGDQLAGLNGGARCEGCHQVSGWDQSTYAAREHAGSGLPLEGRHAAVPCSACHAASRPGLPALPAAAAALGPAGIQFRLGDSTCASCHADPHVTGAGPGQAPECSACHSATAFRPATVSVSTHGELGYPLQGAHRAVPCVACHESLAGRTPAGPALRHAQVAPLDLRIAHQACADCHATPHGDQFSGPQARDCATCHSERGFQPPDRFDHQRDAAFSLEGAHASVACTRCHAPEPVPGGGTRVRWRPVPRQCQDCHDRRAA